MKRFFALLLAVLMVLSLTACVANNNAAQTTDTQTEALSPEAAAEEAAAKTKDTTSLSDIIRVPFGYLLDWLYVFSSNYGVALILFSLIVKLVLLPMSIKSKKSMLKMSRLAPLARSIEAKYGDDRQKAQMAVQQMYKEEGVSMGGGCLWSFIPLLILFPLYYVIREPITYMLHNSRSVSAAIVAFIQASGVDLGKNTYYAQLAAAGHLGGGNQVRHRYGRCKAAGYRLLVPPRGPRVHPVVPLLAVRGLERDRSVPDSGCLGRTADAFDVHQPEDEQPGRNQCRR